MPELRIYETSPGIEVTLEEDDETVSSHVFKREGQDPIDFDTCEDKNGPGKLKNNPRAGGGKTRNGVEISLKAKKKR